MTRLARDNSRLDWRIAGRSFEAKCGHQVEKGEPYRVFEDFFAYNRIHISQCMDCAEKEGALSEFHEFKALCNTKPQNEAQAAWILAAIEKFRRNHPHLKVLIDHYHDKLLREVLEDARVQQLLGGN